MCHIMIFFAAVDVAMGNSLLLFDGLQIANPVYSMAISVSPSILASICLLANFNIQGSSIFFAIFSYVQNVRNFSTPSPLLVTYIKNGENFRPLYPMETMPYSIMIHLTLDTSLHPTTTTNNNNSSSCHDRFKKG